MPILDLGYIKGQKGDKGQNGPGSNIIDNWYFLNPINQRGGNKYTGAGYTIDRWKVNYGVDITTNIVDGGITLTFGAVAYFSQILEEYIVKFIRGKTVTLSIMVNDQLYTATDKINKNGDVSNANILIPGILNASVYSPTSDPDYVYVRIWPNITTGISFPYTTPKIQAIKLELGNEQTLAHKEDNTWVLNDPPPNKAIELAKCQMYYEEGNPYTITSNDVYSMIRFLQEKRVTPDISLSVNTVGADLNGVSVTYKSKSSFRIYNPNKTQFDYKWIANADL